MPYSLFKGALAGCCVFVLSTASWAQDKRSADLTIGSFLKDMGNTGNIVAIDDYNLHLLSQLMPNSINGDDKDLAVSQLNSIAGDYYFRWSKNVLQVEPKDSRRICPLLDRNIGDISIEKMKGEEILKLIEKKAGGKIGLFYARKEAGDVDFKIHLQNAKVRDIFNEMALQSGGRMWSITYLSTKDGGRACPVPFLEL